MKNPHELKRAIARCSLDIHARGWVANHDGNVSARTADGFLITPMALSKRDCGADTIVQCDDDGRPTSKGRPPSEVALHVGVYRARADVNAVLHAHPPHASAFALAGRALEPVSMPEVVVSLGASIPLAPLVLPKDPAAADVAAAAVSGADAVLLAGNGILTVGVDLEQAYLRAELVEHYARIVLISASIGGPAELVPDAQHRLLELRAKAGLGPKPVSSPKAALAASIRPLVAEELRRALERDR